MGLRHTDVLLNIKTDDFYEEVRQNEAKREKDLNILQTKLRLVQDLAQSEGWKFFISELKDEKFKMLGVLERADNATQLAKVSGSLLVVESFLDWPGYVARELEAQLKDMLK